jgi:hypothetical protein
MTPYESQRIKFSDLNPNYFNSLTVAMPDEPAPFTTIFDS